MDNDEWSLDIKNVDLQKDILSKPEILTIVPPTKSEIDNTIEEIKTDPFGTLFKPKKSEVKVLKTEIVYSPYLIVVGRYVARFLRKNNYDLNVKPDVVSVKIKDEIVNVDNKPITVSSLIAKGASGLTVGGGVIGFSFEPVEEVMQKGVSKVLGERDLSLMDKKSVRIPDLLEHAVYDTKDKSLCYDASTVSIVEKPHILKLIRKGTKTKEGRPANHKETLDYKKVIAEAEKKLVKIPNGRILEHVFKISNLSFVFYPKINITLQHKNEKKNLVLDGITLEVFKEKGFFPF
jgi:hypothetical protein